MENEDKKNNLKEKYSRKDTEVNKEYQYRYADKDFGEDYNDKYILERGTSFKLSKKIKVIIGLVVVIIIGAVVAMTFGKKQMNLSKTVNRAENLQELGKYDEAEEILNNLFMTTGDEKYKEMIEYNSLLKKNEEIMKNGIEYMGYNEYIGSIEQFLSITKEDKKHYDQARKKIDEALEKVLIEIRQDIDKEEVIDANEKIERLEVLLPGNKKVEEMKAKVVALKNKLEEKEKEEISGLSSNSDTKYISVGKKEYDDSANLEKMEKNERRVLVEAASIIKDGYETITAKNSNLRSEPSKNASILKTLLKGTKVYIEDTYIESADRIWCKVSYDGATGWISYNTMNGAIA